MTGRNGPLQRTFWRRFSKTHTSPPGGRSSAATLASGGVDHLRATVTLPDSAGNDFQDVSSELELVFSGVQRDGADR